MTLGLYAADNILNITGGGNVGIGTTNPTTANGVYRCAGGTLGGQLYYGATGAAQTLCTGGGGTVTATPLFLP